MYMNNNKLQILALIAVVATVASAENDPICVDKSMELCPHKKFCCPTFEGAICGNEECEFESFAPPPKDKCPTRGEKWCVQGNICCPDTVQCAQDNTGEQYCNMNRTSAIVIPDPFDDNSTMSILPISATTTSSGFLEPTADISPNNTTTGGSPTTTGNNDNDDSGAAKSEVLGGGIAALMAGFAVFVGL